MILNEKFDKKYEGIINLYEPLADWFEKNQDVMAEYGFTHKNCLKFINKNINMDIIILGKMSAAAFNWLEATPDISISLHARAFNAASAIHRIYVDESSLLSDNAKELYNIHKGEIRKNRLVLAKDHK
ncbi:MAG: hypothetical protein IJK67_05885 [Bacilli bacterium]|nr:hypothetical protein [Bacilli bacterium]